MNRRTLIYAGHPHGRSTHPLAAARPEGAGLAVSRDTRRDARRLGRMLAIFFSLMGLILALPLHPAWVLLVLLGLACYLASRFW